MEKLLHKLEVCIIQPALADETTTLLSEETWNVKGVFMQ